VKTIPELIPAVIELEKQRGKPGGDIGTVRVDLTSVEQMRLEAETEGFKLSVDEPRQRGGTNVGLHPLGYFVLGAASCFLTQFARVTILKNQKIDSMEMTARAHYDRSKLRRFTDIIYEVRLLGSESEERAIELLHEAEDRCFTHQSLRRAVPLTTILSLNGKRIAISTLGPE